MNYGINNTICGVTGDAMTHAAIIDALGGYRAVADALGKDPSIIWRWARHGIPLKRWVDVVLLAEVKGVGGVTVASLATAAVMSQQARPARGSSPPTENAA